MIKSIGVKLALWLSLVSLVICGILGFIAYWNGSQALFDTIERDMISEAENGAKLLATQEHLYSTQLQSIADRPEIKQMDWTQQRTVLENEKTRLGFLRMGVANLNGILMLTTGNTTDISDRDYFRKAKAGQFVMTEPMKTKSDGILTVMLACPIYNVDSGVSGVLTATLKAEDLDKIITSIKYGKSGYAYMLNSEGTIIVHPDTKLVQDRNNIQNEAQKDTSLADLQQLEKKMISGEKGFGYYTYNGVAKCLAFCPVGINGWSLAIVQPKAEVMEPINGLMFKIRVFCLIMMIIAVLIGIFIGWRIKKPLQATVNLAQNIANGNLSVQVSPEHVQRKDEIGLLANAFQEMIAGLKESISAIGGEAHSVAAASQELTASAQVIVSDVRDVTAYTGSSRRIGESICLHSGSDSFW